MGASFSLAFVSFAYKHRKLRIPLHTARRSASKHTDQPAAASNEPCKRNGLAEMTASAAPLAVRYSVLVRTRAGVVPVLRIWVPNVGSVSCAYREFTSKSGYMPTKDRLCYRHLLL